MLPLTLLLAEGSWESELDASEPTVDSGRLFELSKSFPF